MKWGALAAMVIDKVPLEKLLFREPDHTKDREELRELVRSMNGKPAAVSKADETVEGEVISETVVHESPGPAEVVNPVKTHLRKHQETQSEVSTEETVAYENRELGKALLSIEKHASQLFRINGKPCDCSQGRHLLFLETESEDTISMVDNPDIYLKILDFVKRLGPISTVEALKTGLYDNEYPAFAKEARDLRKELIGSLDPKALWPKKEEALPEPKLVLTEGTQDTPGADQIPEPTEEAKVEEDTGIVSVR